MKHADSDVHRFGFHRKHAITQYQELAVDFLVVTICIVLLHLISLIDRPRPLIYITFDLFCPEQQNKQKIVIISALAEKGRN